MTAKTTKVMDGTETTFEWNDGYWVHKDGDTLKEYYDEETCRLLLNRLNRGSETIAFGIKKTNGDTMYMPRHFAKVRMLSFEANGKRYSQLTIKNVPNGFDAYFVINDYATKRWVQKTGDNIGKLTDNDEFQLIKELSKISKYDHGSCVKNRRGR